MIAAIVRLLSSAFSLTPARPRLNRPKVHPAHLLPNCDG